jgi:hypothetical protein
MAFFKKRSQDFWHVIRENDRVFERVLISIFFAIGAIGIFNHAMWRDELNGWLLTRDSHTFGELLINVKYEGHPLLWYVLLDLLNRFTANPVAMQVLHLIIATASAYLFLRFSPFSKLQKSLFIFGYLPFYEYLLISRNYAIGLLSIVLFCIVFKTRERTYIWISLSLALMANTNAYCLLIAIALFLALLAEYLFKNLLNYRTTANRENLLISLAIFLIGISLSIAILLPPMDSNLQGGLTEWTFKLDLFHLAKTITRIWNGYILILIPAESRFLDVSIFAIISLAILFFAATIFIKKPIILLFYVLANLEILTFTYVKFLGSARHYGHLYLVFAIALWLATDYPQSDLLVSWFKSRENILAKWIKFVNRYKTTFIMTILYAQLAAGIVSFSRDLVIPYSASRDTAKYIQSQNLEQIFIAGSEDFAISPICAYLNRKVYYPETRQLGSFVLFTRQRNSLNADEVLERISKVFQERDKRQEILLILNYELNTSRNDLEISFLNKFTHAFIGNEKYYLYMVSKVS